MLNIFKKLQNPTLRAKMINNGQQVKVQLINVKDHANIYLLLYSTLVQVARIMKVDHRFLMNKMIDLDKQIIRNAKQDAKAYKKN